MVISDCPVSRQSRSCQQASNTFSIEVPLSRTSNSIFSNVSAGIVVTRRRGSKLKSGEGGFSRGSFTPR